MAVWEVDLRDLDAGFGCCRPGSGDKVVGNDTGDWKEVFDVKLNGV